MPFSIGLDVRMWGHPGIGRYIRELSKELIRQPSEYRLTFLGEAPAAEALAGGRADGRFIFKKTRSAIYSLSEQMEILRQADALDLLHVPHFNIPVFFNKKLVVTVHDLIYLHEPGASRSIFGKVYADYFFKMIQKKAAAIITVSEFTKKDLLNFFPKIRPERVVVTHEAASEVFRKIEDPSILENVRQRQALQNPFILFVGSLRPHKNIPVLVRAIAGLRRTQGIPHDLILVGRPDPRNGELRGLLEENSFVRHLGELPDAELACLYNLADLFVLPSLWEGFGLPVLEAMACGTPVISSNRTSLPEVAGKAGLLFDPLDVDALSGLVYNVLQKKELREKMSQAGFEQAGRFSWPATARRTREVYEEVLG